MDLFSEDAILKLNREEEKNDAFHQYSQSLRILSTYDPTVSFEDLLGVKQLFQKMLPKMPHEYIMRQVFDSKHCSLVLSGGASDAKIIGSVCYRPVFGRGFVEIVFFAIDSDYHVSGYGTFLFSCLKEVCKMQYIKYLREGEAYKAHGLVITDLSIFESNRDDNFQETRKELDLVLSTCNEDSASTPQEHAQEEPQSVETLESSHADDAPRHANQPGQGPDSEPSMNAYESAYEAAQCMEISGDGRTDGALQRCLEEPLPEARRYTNSTSLYLLTYADNSAIGFFKKQGFVLRPVSSKWIGYIKDYDGGTLMECKLHRQINYLKKKELIESVRSLIFQKMKEVNECHIVRDGRDRMHLRPVYDEYCAKEGISIVLSDDISGRTKEEFLYDFIFFLICDIQSSSFAWPFLEPVSAKDVPDYFDVITQPMDLSTILEKHRRGEYTRLRDFSDDIYLMVNNCFTYNGSETQYYRCGENIQSWYEELIEKYKNVIERWGFEL